MYRHVDGCSPRAMRNNETIKQQKNENNNHISGNHLV